MYDQHWGLTELPFRGTPKAPGLSANAFDGPSQEEATARLDFLVEHSRRVGLLIGPKGCGKTTVMEEFQRHLTKLCHPHVSLNLRGMDLHEFLWTLAAAFGGNPREEATDFQLKRTLDDRLAAHQRQEFHTVLLLDDASHAEPDVLGQIVRLATSRAPMHQGLTLVLAAPEASLPHLGRDILDLVDLRIDLEPWNEEDTRAYLDATLRGAGRTEPIFAPESIDQLHHLAGGSPRKISQLAELSLLAGAGMGLERVDEETVQAAFEELCITVDAFLR